MSIKEYFSALLGAGIGAFFVGFMFYTGYKTAENIYEKNKDSIVSLDYHTIARQLGIPESIVLGALIVIIIILLFVAWYGLTSIVYDGTLAAIMEAIVVGSLFLSAWLASEGHDIIAAAVVFVGLVVLVYFMLPPIPPD